MAKYQWWNGSQSLERKSFLVAVTLSALYTVIAPAIGAPWPLHAFLAPLVIALYRYARLTCLWLALAIGTFLDLFTAPFPMGIHAVAYLCAAMLLLRCKNYFFADTFSTLPILVFIGSLLVTSTVIVGLIISGQMPPLSWKLLAVDVFILAFGDIVLACLISSIANFTRDVTKALSNLKAAKALVL